MYKGNVPPSCDSKTQTLATDVTLSRTVMNCHNLDHNPERHTKSLSKLNP
jgi:hypothetical protein